MVRQASWVMIDKAGRAKVTILARSKPYRAMVIHKWATQTTTSVALNLRIWMAQISGKITRWIDQTTFSSTVISTTGISKARIAEEGTNSTKIKGLTKDKEATRPSLTVNSRSKASIRAKMMLKIDLSTKTTVSSSSSHSFLSHSLSTQIKIRNIKPAKLTLGSSRKTTWWMVALCKKTRNMGSSPSPIQWVLLLSSHKSKVTPSRRRTQAIHSRPNSAVLLQVSSQARTITNRTKIRNSINSHKASQQLVRNSQTINLARVKTTSSSKSSSTQTLTSFQSHSQKASFQASSTVQHHSTTNSKWWTHRHSSHNSRWQISKSQWMNPALTPPHPHSTTKTNPLSLCQVLVPPRRCKTSDRNPPILSWSLPLRVVSSQMAPDSRRMSHLGKVTLPSHKPTEHISQWLKSVSESTISTWYCPLTLSLFRLLSSLTECKFSQTPFQLAKADIKQVI